MKLLIVSPWKDRWSLGGTAGVSDDHHFITETTRRGFDLHFLVPRGGDAGPAPAHVFFHTYADFFGATERWPKVIRWLIWPALFALLVSVKAVILARRVRPDFVLGHSHYSAIPVYMCHELLGIPSGLKLFGVMDLVHTEWPKWKYYLKNLEQIVALKVPQDVWIILDDGTRGRDAALRHGVPGEKILFLPNGIDKEWLDVTRDRDASRREMGLDPDARVALFLSRLVDSKRPELAIEAIPSIRQRAGDSLLLVVIGDGPARERCETLVEQLGVAGHVRFTGAIPHDRVPIAMAASDVFVSTSRLTNAAIPTCEAFVCGVPVVVFDVGDTTSIVRHDVTGVVVPDGDVQGLAQAVADLLVDDNRCRALADNARRYAAEHFVDWPERVTVEIEAIRSVVERDSQAGSKTG